MAEEPEEDIYMFQGAFHSSLRVPPIASRSPYHFSVAREPLGGAGWRERCVWRRLAPPPLI